MRYLYLIKLVIISAMWMVITPANSQTVSGIIQDKNGVGITNALVHFSSANSENKSSSNSKDSGKFRLFLKSSGRYSLTIESIGFITYHDTVIVTSDINLGAITLASLEDTALKSKTLQEVNISGQREVAQHLSDREVIDVENTYLGKLPATSDLLNQIPEITFDGSAISVLGKNNVGIYINGHQSEVSINSIPVQNISKIEIITNPSSKYDARMEAIINVILKKGIDDGLQNEFFATYEKRYGHAYSFGSSLSYNKGNINSSLNIGYDARASKKINSNSSAIFNKRGYTFTSDTYETSNGHSLNINLETILLINKSNKIMINANWLPSYTPQQNFNESDNFTNHVTVEIDSSITSNVLWSYYTRFANAGISLSNTNKIFTIEPRFDVFWQDDGTKTDNSFLSYNLNSSRAPIIIKTNQYRQNTAYIPSLNFSHPFSNSQLEFGAKYYYIPSKFFLDFSSLNFYTPDQNNLFSSTENIFAQYIKYDGHWNKINYEFGLRNEYSTQSGFFNGTPNNYNLSKILPSINLSYSITENNKLSLSYSEKLSRVPFSLQSPLFYYNGPYTAFEGNPLLRPQTLHSVQMKYLYKSCYATLYYNNYSNFLSTLPYINNNTTILKFSNYNRINYGIIFGTPITFMPWWSSQNTLKIYYQSNNGTINSTKFHFGSWTSNVIINETFKVLKAKLTLLFNYTLPYFSGVNKIKTNPSFDINFTQPIAHNRVQLSLYIRDIFHTYSYSYIYRNVEGVLYNSSLLKDTRGITFSIKYNFERGRSTLKGPENKDDIQLRL